MTAEDWAHIGVLTNESVLQWYSTVTQKPIAASPSVISTPLPGGGSATINTNTLLLLGALVVLAFVMMRN